MDKRYKQEYNRFPHFLVYSVIGRDLYNMVSDSGELAEKKAVSGALRLYLDFINLFIMLLHLFGNRE